MTGEKLRGLDPNPFGEPDFKYKSYEEHMEDLNKEESEKNEEAEENPNKRKYLEDLKECEEKLEQIHEKFEVSLEEAYKYVNVIQELIKESAPDEAIQEELKNLNEAVQSVAKNSADLLEQNEELCEYLKLDDDFLTQEEHGIRHDKYFNNIEAMNEFAKIQKMSEDVSSDAKRKSYYNKDINRFN